MSHSEHPFEQARRAVQQRELTETIRVTSEIAIPAGYVRIPTLNTAIYARAQVLSRQLLKPIFVETDPRDASRRVAYWVSGAVMTELAEWIRNRVFTEDDVLK